MRISKDFSEYKPWSGAVDTMERLEEKGITMEQLENALEDIFCAYGDDTVDECHVNDLLWFEPEVVYECLGISEDDDDDDDEPDLPDSCEIDIADLDYDEEEDDLDIAIGDYLSDTYGYCINKFNFFRNDESDYITVTDIDWDTTD